MSQPTYLNLDEFKKNLDEHDNAKLLIQDGVIEAIDENGELLFRSYSKESVLAEALDLLDIPWGRVQQ